MATNNAINLSYPTPISRVALSSIESNLTGDGSVHTIIFDFISYDPLNCYNNVTGKFKAPENSFYLFSCSIYLIVTDSNCKTAKSNLKVVANDNYFSVFNPYEIRNSTNRVLSQLTKIVYMNKDEEAYMTFMVSGGTKTCGLSNASTRLTVCRLDT